MRNIFATLSVGTLMALGATAFLGWGANGARAQSPCLTQCVNSGSSEATCRNYCFGSQGPQVYGYYSGADPQNPAAAAGTFTEFSDDAGRPVTRCWPGYDQAYSAYPCWAQEALSRERR